FLTWNSLPPSRRLKTCPISDWTRFTSSPTHFRRHLRRESFRSNARHRPATSRLGGADRDECLKWKKRCVSRGHSFPPARLSLTSAGLTSVRRRQMPKDSIGCDSGKNTRCQVRLGVVRGQSRLGVSPGY